MISWRRPVLLLGVAIAVLQAVVAAPARVATVAVLVVLACLSTLRRIPAAAFVVRPGSASFTTPVRAWPVFFAVLMMALAGDRVGTLARSAGGGDWPAAEVCLAGLQLTAALLMLVQAWRDHDLCLRPDGLHARRNLGSVIVPWEAVPVAHTGPRRPRKQPGAVFPPGAFAPHDTDPADERAGVIRLSYGRPELVRRRGLVRDADHIVADHVDARFLAAAIGYYAAHAGQRAAIGTEEGYRTLREALAGGPDGSS